MDRVLHETVGIVEHIRGCANLLLWKLLEPMRVTVTGTPSDGGYEA